MKAFNTAGTCRPNRHYMVDITERLEIIKGMVANGDYFCINRGRQYGKTTTLAALKSYLENSGYCVFSMSFEALGQTSFSTDEELCATFLWLMKNAVEGSRVIGLSDKARSVIINSIDNEIRPIKTLIFSQTLCNLCSYNDRPIVLFIDEVDKASNNGSLISLLSILRQMYLYRDEMPTFQSVILAGVYDIKNLKLKMRPDDEHQYNSPWNIAVPFDVDMSLSAEGIAGMLAEYKADHNLDFDEKVVAQMIRDYTSGYPFLVSRICQIIDTMSLPWNKEGILKAVNQLLNEGNTLFDDIVKKLDQYPELVRTIKGVLFQGMCYPFNYYDKATNLAIMLSFVKQDKGAFAIACRIFEIWFYNYFISQDKNTDAFVYGMDVKNQFIHDSIIDMPLLLERFAKHMNQTFSMDKDHKFLEKNGRQIFLTYLRPIINGIGSYHIEEQTRDMERMDVVIDYLGKQYVVELKIWRGDSYNTRGEEQLARYLEYFDLQEGYLLSFCFNKSKQVGLLPPVEIKGRTLIEVIV